MAQLTGSNPAGQTPSRVTHFFANSRFGVRKEMTRPRTCYQEKYHGQCNRYGCIFLHQCDRQNCFFLSQKRDFQQRPGVGKTQNRWYKWQKWENSRITRQTRSSQSRKQSKPGPECTNWTYERKTMCTEKHKHGNLLKFKVEKLIGRSATKTRFSTKTRSQQSPKQVIQMTDMGKRENYARRAEHAKRKRWECTGKW